MKHSIWKILLPVLGIILIAGIALSLLKQQLAPPKGTGEERAQVQIGSTLPDFTLQPFQGKPAQLSDLGAKVVMVNFWATWCEACMVEMPSIVKIQHAYRDKGFKVVAINVDEKPESVLPPVLKQLGIDFQVYTDTEAKIADIFDVHAIPLTVIMDKQRKILLVHNGEFDWAGEAFRAKLDQWLAQ